MTRLCERRPLIFSEKSRVFVRSTSQCSGRRSRYRFASRTQALASQTNCERYDVCWSNKSPMEKQELYGVIHQLDHKEGPLYTRATNGHNGDYVDPALLNLQNPSCTWLRHICLPRRPRQKLGHHSIKLVHPRRMLMQQGSSCSILHLRESV